MRAATTWLERLAVVARTGQTLTKEELGGFENLVCRYLDEALAMSAHRPEGCLILQRPQAEAAVRTASAPRAAA